MMKTRLQRTELLRAAQALSTPKRTAAMFLMAMLAILTFPTKTWAQDPIAKIGDTPYESLRAAFNEEPLYVRIGVNLTVKGGTIGGPDADNACEIAIRNLGGKLNIENLTISNCRDGIYNEEWLDDETSVAGELTIGSGVHISATETCIDYNLGKLMFTALPILSWGEENCGITLGGGKVINFAGEGITALPDGFKPIKIIIHDELPCVITNGYADHMKSGSEVIDPAKVFVGEDNDISTVIYDGEATMTMTYGGGIQNVSVTKGNEVKQYISLRAAFNEAADGSTITLLDNADLGEGTIVCSYRSELNRQGWNHRRSRCRQRLRDCHP